MATLQNTTITTTSGTDTTSVQLKVDAGGGGVSFDKAGFFSGTSLTSGTTVSWDVAANQVAGLTLGHNATMGAATNQANGGVYILKVTQGSSAKTLSWNSNYKWPGDTAPVMTATASAIDVFTFVSDGTYMYGSFSGSQNFT